MHKESNNNNQERPSNLLRFGGHFVQGGSNQISFSDNMISFLDHFQEATEKITSDSKVLLDHLGEDEQECEYFSMAENGVISYKSAMFVCDYERNELQLGDCSNRSKCLTIPLTNGGNLVVNRDNIEELKDAITMFSPEDQLLIMKAIMMDKRAQEVLREIEEEKKEELLEEDEDLILGIL